MSFSLIDIKGSIQRFLTICPARFMIGIWDLT